jgi:hypothetical protein
MLDFLREELLAGSHAACRLGVHNAQAHDSMINFRANPTRRGRKHINQ